MKGKIVLVAPLAKEILRSRTEKMAGQAKLSEQDRQNLEESLLLSLIRSLGLPGGHSEIFISSVAEDEPSSPEEAWKLFP